MVCRQAWSVQRAAFRGEAVRPCRANKTSAVAILLRLSFEETGYGETSRAKNKRVILRQKGLRGKSLAFEAKLRAKKKRRLLGLRAEIFLLTKPA